MRKDSSSARTDLMVVDDKASWTAKKHLVPSKHLWILDVSPLVQHAAHSVTAIQKYWLVMKAFLWRFFLQR